MSRSPKSYLLVRAGTFRCALPLECVREVTRPLPLSSSGCLPPAVLGASIVRGNALPVVSLPALLGLPVGNETRFVVVATSGRDCVLAVDAIERITSLDHHRFEPLPRLLQGIEAAQTIAAVDRDLIVMLDLALVETVLPPVEDVPA